MCKDLAAARHGRSELCLGIGPTAKRITNSTLSQNLEAYLLLFFSRFRWTVGRLAMSLFLFGSPFRHVGRQQVERERQRENAIETGIAP